MSLGPSSSYLHLESEEKNVSKEPTVGYHGNMTKNLYLPMAFCFSGEKEANRKALLSTTRRKSVPKSSGTLTLSDWIFPFEIEKRKAQSVVHLLAQVIFH